MEVIIKMLESKTLKKQITESNKDQNFIKYYAMRSIKNAIIDNYRKHQRDWIDIGKSDEENSSFIDNLVDGGAEGAVFNGLRTRDALNALKKTGQECLEIIVYFSAGFKYAELAEKFGIPTGTVMSRMARCRKRLEKIQEEA